MFPGKSGLIPTIALLVAYGFSSHSWADDQVVPEVYEPETDEIEIPSAPELLSQFWELEPEHKRGLYTLRTYRQNYVLPYHYSDSMNKQASSPTLGDTTRNDTFKDYEMKIQLSFRTKLLEDFLISGSDLWVAYTQTSLWQAYDEEDSRPFRSTDHNPEVFYVVPLFDKFDPIPGAVDLQMLKVGLAHHSNGQSEPESRSWNYWHIGGSLGYRGLILETSYKHRINEARDDDDNPDLEKYRGNLETSIGGLVRATSFTLTRHSQYLKLNRGYWKLDITHPVSSSRPDGLRLHLQIFSGYGETLLDYNHHQTRIGVGFVLLNI